MDKLTHKKTKRQLANIMKETIIKDANLLGKFF